MTLDQRIRHYKYRNVERASGVHKGGPYEVKIFSLIRATIRLTSFSRRSSILDPYKLGILQGTICERGKPRGADFASKKMNFPESYASLAEAPHSHHFDHPYQVASSRCMGLTLGNKEAEDE